MLVFGTIRDWGTDTVSTGPVTNDKDFHRWGQSEQGMRQLVERLTRPGDFVYDPFLALSAGAHIRATNTHSMHL